MPMQAIVAEGNECTINGLKVQIKPHHNKDWIKLDKIMSCEHEQKLGRIRMLNPRDLFWGIHWQILHLCRTPKRRF